MFFHNNELIDVPANRYKPLLTAMINDKGVLDVDTVKGCSFGTKKYPDGGCYSECYAYKNAKRYGIDFTVSVSRKMLRENGGIVFDTVKNHTASWYRIGTHGDPCHDWDNTCSIIEALKCTNKIPVVITKHWISFSDIHIDRLRKLSVVVNTSVSGMDTDMEIKHRVEQVYRLRENGIRSVIRIVTCNYGRTEYGRKAKEKQDYLLSIIPNIDNPLRAGNKNVHVLKGDIILSKINNAKGNKFISLHDKNIYLGICEVCPDQCGVEILLQRKKFNLIRKGFDIIQ